MIYAFPADGTDRYASLAPLIAADLSAIDGWWRRQDPSRTIRFDLFAFPGCSPGLDQLDISRVQLSQPASYYAAVNSRGGRLVGELNQRFAEPSKKYLVYYDGVVDEPRLCGQSTRRPGPGRPLRVLDDLRAGMPRGRRHRRDHGERRRPRARPQLRRRPAGRPAPRLRRRHGAHLRRRERPDVPLHARPGPERGRRSTPVTTTTTRTAARGGISRTRRGSHTSAPSSRSRSRSAAPARERSRAPRPGSHARRAARPRSIRGRRSSSRPSPATTRGSSGGAAGAPPTRAS